MLKYNLNINKQRGDLIPIDISDYDSDDIFEDIVTDDSGNITSLVYINRKKLTFYCNDEVPFEDGATVAVRAERNMLNDEGVSFTAFSYSEPFKALSVNKQDRTFSLEVDKYTNLNVSNTKIDGDWWYIYFNGSHLFNSVVGEVFRLYVSFDNFDTTVTSPVIFYIGKEVGVSYTTVSEDTEQTWVSEGEYVSSTVVRISKEVLETKGGNLKNIIFYSDDGKDVNDVSRVNFYRDDVIFTNIDEFELLLDRPMAAISIPLSIKFSTDLMMDDAIGTNFTEAEKKKSINKINEMEKDIYHPVIWDSSTDRSNGNYGAVKSEVYKIRFNLHFREHRGDDWLAPTDSYWNGTTRDEDGKLSFIKDNYFIYSDKGEQSDLLTYLNFTDKDVRYQKSKIKKSFLRVMFYDSMSPTNQNMLAYYTIFMDSGSFFSKYARFIETGGYFSTSKTGLNGIKVNREPTNTQKDVSISSISGDKNRPTRVEEIEGVRLSSQFVVQDKYMSDSSSEGFYLYLWKDNMDGVLPTDIYMKVEFNHAGYGRTIPFMCPYWDKDKDGGRTGFKTFDEILADWDESSGSYNPYGIQKYLRYSYIRFKYKYDKVGKRHVYYLDDEFYGSCVHFYDNAITINLYEAKIV